MSGRDHPDELGHPPSTPGMGGVYHSLGWIADHIEVRWKRRLRWFGHLVRSDAQDTARKCLMKEVDSGSVWWKLIFGDLRAVGICSFADAERLAADRIRWRTLSHARSGINSIPLS